MKVSKENNVAVVTDSGSSMRENYPEVKESEIKIIPLEVKFFENGEWVPYLDSNLTPEEFYTKMASGIKTPQTSGSILGRAAELYKTIGSHKPIISIHITSQHSVAHESALLAANMIKEVNPEVVIEVIDSKLVSIGTWFLAQKAAEMSALGYPIEDIKKVLLETIPKIDLLTVLPSLDNLIKGGRVPALTGMIGNLFQIKPLVGFVDGKITQLSKNRTFKKAKQELISRAEGVKEDITQIAILHTNNLQGAKELQTDLNNFYTHSIPIFEAGPVLGVHTGPGGVGIAILKK